MGVEKGGARGGVATGITAGRCNHIVHITTLERMFSMTITAMFYSHIEYRGGGGGGLTASSLDTNVVYEKLFILFYFYFSLEVHKNF